ncbi:MAG: hypothetical protein J0M18_05070 [Ignavibacteria bacterium]|nr:hypothetical protein [Ignavibacteria bacterium]
MKVKPFFSFLPKTPIRDFTGFKKTFVEAKQSEFTFNIFRFDDEFSIHHENVIFIEDSRFICQTDAGELEVKFGTISEIQSLPKSKCINLVLTDEKFLRNKLLKFSIPLLLGFVGIIVSTFIDDNEKEAKYLLLGASVATIISSYLTFFTIAFSVREELNKLSKRAASTSKTSTLIKSLEKASSEEEYFNKLINVNLSNMESYYLLVKLQTTKSFRITVFGIIVGFLILISGIVIKSYIKDVGTGDLTIISGVLIEFISAGFFYLYNRTVLQLNIYHDKLVAVQDTMLALRVAQSIKDDPKLKNETMRYLTEILTNKLVKHPESIKKTDKEEA